MSLLKQSVRVMSAMTWTEIDIVVDGVVVGVAAMAWLPGLSAAASVRWPIVGIMPHGC